MIGLLLHLIALIHFSVAQEDPHETLYDACTLHLAPSSIPNAGIGIYTSIARKKGDTIGDPDVYIPLVDMRKHHNTQSKDWFWPLGNYVWNGDYMGMQSDSERLDVTAYCPGLDCAVNGDLRLINVGGSRPQFDWFSLHRSKDPGAGSITPYHNGTSSVVYDIPAGGELFKDYGDHWFANRYDAFGNIPFQGHHVEAEIWASQFEALLQRISGAYASCVDGHEKCAKWAMRGECEKNPVYMHKNCRLSCKICSKTQLRTDLSLSLRHDLWNVVVSMPFDTRAYNAFPKTYTQAVMAVNAGIRSVYQPDAIRSKEYLNEYGRCIDHIEPRAQSTLVQAGRGAFAKHFLPQGSIVTGSPLTHFIDRDYLNLYEFEDLGDGRKERNVNKIVGHQLLMNYCFGHPDTTMMMCPYGAAVNYINHNKTLANVKIQWAPDGMINQNDTWFNMTPDEMRRTQKTNLAIDYVALQDIKRGEELFLDYGDDFEKAWIEHVANWKPPEDSESYVSAHEWNERYRSTPIRTSEEQKEDPYPENLLLRCHGLLATNNWTQYEDWDQRWDTKHVGVPCEVLAHYGNFYDIKIVIGPLKKEIVLQKFVPRNAFRFMEENYSTDIHLANAFRHEIHLPDSMIPEKWRNAKTKLASELDASRSEL